jgi:hypothetical protein
MNKVKEFLYLNKKDIYWIIPTFILGSILLGARQKALSTPTFWLVIPLGLFVSMLFGFLLTIFTEGKGDSRE